MPFIAVIVLIVAGFGFWRYNNRVRVATLTAEINSTPTLNQTLDLPIMIDTAGATINAAEIYLKFDPAAIRVEAVTKDNSFFQLWITDEPKFSNESGEISFAGGLPKPGFSGRGQIGSIKIIPLKTGQAEISFESKTRALLNDGKGTAIALELPPIQLEIKK